MLFPCTTLFRSLQVVVFEVALVAHLRPAAHARAARLDVLHFVALKRLAATEDEEARAVRVGDENGVARVLVHDARERVEVRSEEHTSELQSHHDLCSFPARRSSVLCRW